MKYIKEIITIGLIAIAVLFIFEKIRTNKLISKNKELELINNKLDNNLMIFKDENGFYRAKAESAESDLKTIKNVYEDELKLLRKDFNNINRNYKNLNSVYNTSLKTIGSLNAIIESYDKFVDTTYNNDGSIDNIKYIRKFTYNDDWANFNGEFTLNTNQVNLDNININYEIKDSLTLVSYYKREKLFGKRQLFVEGKSYNPNTKISNLNEIRVNNHKEPKWSLGTQAGYGLTQYGMGWYVGVGINRKLIQW